MIHTSKVHAVCLPHLTITWRNVTVKWHYHLTTKYNHYYIGLTCYNVSPFTMSPRSKCMKKFQTMGELIAYMVWVFRRFWLEKFQWEEPIYKKRFYHFATLHSRMTWNGFMKKNPEKQYARGSILFLILYAGYAIGKLCTKLPLMILPKIYFMLADSVRISTLPFS